MTHTLLLSLGLVLGIALGKIMQKPITRPIDLWDYVIIGTALGLATKLFIL